jgi:hypothetical protein
MEEKCMSEPDEISVSACSRSSNVGQIANQAVMPLAEDGVSRHDRDGALPYCVQNALGVRGMKKKGGKDAH